MVPLAILVLYYTCLHLASIATLCCLAAVCSYILTAMVYNQCLLAVVLLFTAVRLVIPAADQLGNATYEVRVLETPQGEVCPSAEQLEMTRSVIQNQILAIIRERVLPPPPSYECGGTSGWTRVAFINMTDPSQECPSGLALTSYSKRTCGRTTSAYPRCDSESTSFSVGGMTYSRVCGRIIGYQFGDSYAFLRYNIGRATTIDSTYVAGVSLTHRAPGPRQHIWTFAIGRTETDQSGYAGTLCPCSTTGNVSVPPFVGNNYFCESGLNTAYTGSSQYVLYPDDPLWDGQSCRAGTTCCQFNTPPWFTRDLPTSTSDDIELRLCYEDDSNFEDIPLELIELYVQ